MSEPDIFPAALDLVLDALSARERSGSAIKAPVADLAAFLQVCSAHAPAAPSSSKASIKALPAASKPVAAAASAPTETRPKRATSVSSEKPQLPIDHVFPALPEQTGEGDARERLEALRSMVLPCTLCPSLAATRAHVVFGEGNPHAELMFVGEAPGADEDLEGRPFAGEAGALLDKMLVAMGLSRELIYMSSVLKCRPDVPADEPGSRPPTPAELARCAPYLAAQIAIIQPKVIVALGAGAMSALFGTTQPMGKLRSHWLALHGIPVMPTFHPTYLIRNPANSEKRIVWEDLLQVLERLGHPISEKQQGYFKPKA